MNSVIATRTAIEAIGRLRARHGTIAFHQSGGCCEGSAPMCLTAAELPAGPNDIQLGEIGGVPFLIDRDQHERWGCPDFVVDVAPGSSDSFSLEASDGIHFTSQPPIDMRNEEIQP
jgi:uncharacterized protein (DUF779 family)